MKKIIKPMIIILGIILILIILDLSSIFLRSKPIFAVMQRTPGAYSGILYDTYNCPEYTVPQIKMKGTKFGCSLDIKQEKIINIKDKTLEMKEFACASALEQFYQDENYTYFHSCIKDSYIIVEYESGRTEKVSEALAAGRITIEDLDRFNIKYYKEKNPDFQEITWERTTDSDTEFITFYEDKTFSYYCACGSPVDSSDLCDKYTYDKKTKTITLKCLGKNQKIKILEVTNNTLTLEFKDGIRKFTKEQ